MAWTVMYDVMQWVDGNGDPASGYVIKAYEPGTTTPISIAIDKNGGSPQATITLNAEGKPEVSGNEVMLFIDRDYKWAVFANASDAAANSNPYAGFYDNIPQSNEAGDIVYANATLEQKLNNLDALSYAELKVITITQLSDNDSCNVRYRASENDGGGGIFHWDASNLSVEVSADTQSGIYVAPTSDVTGASGAWVRQWDRSAFNIRWFGAVGDGSTDDAPVVQAVIDYAAKFGDGATLVARRRSGMEIFFPNGCYRLEQQIELPQAQIRITGTGRFHNYPQVYEIQSDSLPVLMPVHTERNLFLVEGNNEDTKISMADINMATLEAGDMPTAAVGFKSGTAFNRDSIFERVGIFGFTSAFDVYTSGGSGVGVVTIRNCAINRNTWIFRCQDSQICNKLIFKDNEAGQNTNGLDLIGHAITINDNVLESCADTIRINGSYRGCQIKGNYFEANSGDYGILLNATKGAEIGPNFWNALTVQTPLLLFKTRDTIIHDTDVTPAVEGAFDPKADLKLFRVNDSTYQQKGASFAKFWDNNLVKTQESQGVTEIGTTQLTNPSGYHKNIINSAGSARTSSGTGIVTFNQAGLSESSGTFIGVSILATYDSDIVEFPRMNVRLNSGTADGFHDAQFSEFDNTTPSGTDKLGNRTVLYTVIAKATNAITNVQTQFYPWGLNPTAGLTATTSVPFVFTINNNGVVEPFLPQEFLGHSTAIPTSSSFPLGWKVYNKDPLATEYEGWIHVGSGTWKGFGLVQT